MDDFFTWAMSYLVDLGYEDARPMLDFKVTNVIGRMSNDDFCYIFAAIKFLNFRDSKFAPPYDSYARLYEESVDAKYRRFPCGGSEMARALGLKKGELLRWQPKPPQGFPLYMQIALTAAVDSGSDRAADAWHRWEGRVNPRDPSRSPEWSILPRSKTAGTAR